MLSQSFLWLRIKRLIGEISCNKIPLSEGLVSKLVHELQFQRRLCPGAVCQAVSWRLWREKLSHVLFLVLKKAVSASCLLTSSFFFCGVCLCVHTSPFHKDVGPIEEDTILQTLLNLITFIKDFSSKKKTLCILRSSQQAIFSGGGGSRFHLLAKESSRDDVARLKILLRGEHVGVGGGSDSHFPWLPCVGEIELETKPPTARTASSQEQRRKKQFCYWTSTEVGMHEHREKAAKEAAKTEGNIAPYRQVETSHTRSGEQQYLVLK